MAVDFGAYEALTFDCYGTLIDWEAGLLAALRQAVPGAADVDDDALLETYAWHEAEAEKPPYRSYREVLAAGVRGVVARLSISEACPLILPYHSALDHAREASKGEKKIGTTGRGIGPAYEDKVARRAIRLQDLLDEKRFAAKLRELLEFHNFVLEKFYKRKPVDYAKTLEETLALAPRFQPLIGAAETLIAFNDVPAPLGVMQAVSILLIAVPMLRGGFAKRVAWLGAVTGVVGIVSEALRPWLGWAYAGYGLLLFVWMIWIGWELWRLGRAPALATERARMARQPS